MTIRAGLVATLVLLTASVQARADRPADPLSEPASGAATTTPPAATPSPTDEPKLIKSSHSGSTHAEIVDELSHKHQFGLSMQLSTGLRSTFTYNDTDYCGSTDSQSATGNAQVCLTRAPVALDFAGSYGLTDYRELIAEFRVALESDFGTTAGATASGPHVLRLAPGMRFFFKESKSLKMFTTAQVVFDFTGYQDNSGNSRGTDFGVRNINGLWFDGSRTWGIYGFFGETALLRRWMEVDLEVGIGVQIRLP